MPECPSGQDIGSGSRWTVLECTGRKAVGPTKPILGQLSEAQTRQSRWNPGAGSNPAAPTFSVNHKQTKLWDATLRQEQLRTKQSGWLKMQVELLSRVQHQHMTVSPLLSATTDHSKRRELRMTNMNCGISAIHLITAKRPLLWFLAIG